MFQHYTLPIFFRTSSPENHLALSKMSEIGLVVSIEDVTEFSAIMGAGLHTGAKYRSSRLGSQIWINVVSRKTQHITQ